METRRCCPRTRQIEESETLNEARRIEELRKQKTELLFEFLRRIQEINRQIKVIGIREDIAEINRHYDKSLMELFVRDGK